MPARGTRERKKGREGESSPYLLFHAPRHIPIMFANLIHDEPMHSESSAVVDFDISTHNNPLQSDSQQGLVGLPQPVPTGGLHDHQPQNSDDISYANLSHEELKQLHLTFLKPSAASSVRMQAPARKTNSRPETPTATSLASAPSTPAMQSPVSQPTTPIMIQQQPQVVVLQTAQPFGDTGDYPLDFSPIPVQYAAINTNPVFITQAQGTSLSFSPSFLFLCLSEKTKRREDKSRSTTKHPKSQLVFFLCSSLIFLLWCVFSSYCISWLFVVRTQRLMYPSFKNPFFNGSLGLPFEGFVCFF